MDIAILLAVVGSVVLPATALIVMLVRKQGKVVKNPPDPDAVPSGSMAVSYWTREFDRLDSKLDKIIVLLSKIANKA